MSTKKKLDVCLIADHSISLNGVGGTINEALAKMLDEIKNSPYLHGCEVYFTLVSFGNDMSKIVDFAPIDSVSSNSLAMTFKGQTNPGPALAYVVDKAYARCYEWKNNGEEAFHPLIFFFTDGCPYPVSQYMPEYEKVAAKIKDLEAKEKLIIVAAGYGNANIDNLKLLTERDERVLRMSDARTDKLSRFFNEIIPISLTSLVTGTFNQMVNIFKNFTNS